MSRPLTSYVYITPEQAGKFADEILAGRVVSLTDDDGRLIHIALDCGDDNDADCNTTDTAGPSAQLQPR